MSSSSAMLLGALLAVLILAGLLYAVGLIDRAITLVNNLGKRILYWGYSWWRPLFGWAHWSIFLGFVLALHAGWGLLPEPHTWPALLVGAGLIWIGLVTCLACIFFELERYQVLRGTMVLHDPAIGQRVAANLAKYGHRAGVPLLLAANVAIISGFSLLNEGLFYTLGESWYVVGAHKNNPNIPPEEPVADPHYSDFLAYSLINIFRIVDLVDVTNTFNFVRVAYVHQIRWPAALLLLVFKTFYSFVLLQQFFAAMRRFLGMGEILEDFWNPHQPIHERAQAAMAQYGLAALPPLFASLPPSERLPTAHRERMVDIVVSLGPNVIPVLKKYLHHPHPDVRTVSVAALGRLEAIDLVRVGPALLTCPDLTFRQALVEALSTLAQQGELLIQKSSVLRDSADARRRVQKFWKLIRFSGQKLQPLAALAEILKLLTQDPDATVRAQAVQGLGYLKSQGDSVAPVLQPLLADPEEAVRLATLKAFAHLGRVRGAVVPTIIAFLQSPNEALQLAALAALATNAEAEKEAAPQLLALLHDRSDVVRERIFGALERMNALPAEAKPQLLAGLDAADNEVRARTIEALGSLGAAATEAVPALLQTLHDENDAVRRQAAEALGKMPASEASIKALTAALADHDNEVRCHAATALGQFGPAAHAALPGLLAIVTAANPTVRTTVLEALARIWGEHGRNDPRCRAVLEQALADETASVREQALAWTACCLPAEAEPLLAPSLQDTVPSVRAIAAKTLGTLPTLQASTIQQLAAALHDENDHVQLAAAHTLAEKGHATPDVVAGLTQLLRDTNPEVQLQGALALSKFGPDAQAAGTELFTLAKSGTGLVREQALKALAMILPEQAIAAFVTALHDPDANLRKIASAGFLRLPTLAEADTLALLDGLNDPEPQVRANVALWLSRQEKIPESAVPLLTRLTSDTDDGLRLSVVRALRTTTDPETRRALAMLLDDPHPQVRAEAAVLILRLDNDHVRARDLLTTTLADPAYPQRKTLVNLLKQYADTTPTFAVLVQEHGAATPGEAANQNMEATP